MRFRQAAFWGIPLLLAAATFAALQILAAPNIKPRQKHGLRIATYNIGWLNSDMSSERKAHLLSVLKNVDADVYALQEIADKQTLGKIFGPEWKTAILDDPSENQEAAVAVREPLKIVAGPQAVFSEPEFDEAFPGKRDVVRTVVETPAGFQMCIYVVHMKSRGGTGGRKATDAQRIFACSMLAAYIRGRQEQNVVVLGDFNDTPDDASVSILETGDLSAKPGPLDKTGPFLYDLATPLASKDGVTFGLDEMYRGSPMQPYVKGARAENDRWRGKEYRFPDDLAVTQALFDQILVSRSLYEVLDGSAQIYSGKDALEGIHGQTSKQSDGTVIYRRQGTLASDHLPVYADFRIWMDRRSRK